MSKVLFKKQQFATFSLLLIFALQFFVTTSASAQCRLLNEHFNSSPALSSTNVDGAWYPDRYPPAAFTSAVLGSENVLKIHIDGVNDGLANRPAAYQSTFYNTQGRKFNQCGKCVTVLKGDLYIPADWASNKRRSDMWATAYNASNNVSYYPIIGFRNPDGVSPGIYYWDDINSVWINSGVSITYNSWYNLQSRLVGLNVQYLVNNVVVGTLPSNGSTYYGDIIMQAYNFNDPSLGASQSSDSYDAYWDNVVTTGTGGNVVTNINTGLSYCSIQGAINDPLTVNGNTISVGPGLYNEDVTVSKQLTIQGAGPSASTVSGPIGGSGSTFAVTASGSTIKGFTITRDGNNTTDWNNPNLNIPGVSIQGLSVTGVTIRDNVITGNRTGIDINNSGGHFILNNTITDNRTGLIFRNQTDNMTVQSNFITNNWTVGIVFLDGSGGTNSPVQTAANSSFNNNDISGNWYGQVVDRQTGGSLPAPGSNLKNFTCNWWGTTSPVVTTANSSEPGYAAQIPVEFGGTATPPGGQPDIAGPASANIVYIPYLLTGDADESQTGFQPQPNSCSGGTHVHNTTQGTHYITIQQGVNAANPGDVIVVDPGTYNENVTVNKSLTLKGANYGVSCSGGRSTETVVNGMLGSNTATFDVQASNVNIDGFTITNHNGSYGISENGRSNLDFEHNIITDVGNNTTGSGASYGVYIEVGNSVASNNVSVLNNCINNIRGGQNTSLTGSAAKSNNGSAGGVLVGSSNVTQSISGLSINGNKIDHITAATVAFTNGGKGAYGVIINVGASTSGQANSPSIHNNEITVIEGLWAHGVGLEGKTPGATVTNNIISHLADHKSPADPDAVGVRVEDNSGASSVAINYNSITNTIISISNKTNAVVDGTCNWYGTVNQPAIAATISGTVTYDPWLNSGNDGSPSVGFQPTGSCTGTANDWDGDGTPNATTTTVVSDCNLNGWQITNEGASTVTFTFGPATPPLSSGSAQFNVGSNGDDFSILRTPNYAGTKLSSLSKLSYSTYVQQWIDGQVPYLSLYIDNDNDGVIDDRLYFEPVYQTGSYSGDPVPNQGAVALNTWQTWNALAGGWWSENDANFGPPLITLNSYIAAHPDATIVNSSTGLGGVRIIAGGGAGAWDNFIGNADNLQVGVNGNTTVYDFEQCPPTITFTATTTGGSTTTTTAGNPSTVALNFCAGESFTFSGFSSSPATNVGVLEMLTSTGNTTYNGSPIPASRPQQDLPPSTLASFFSGTYGPYDLSSGSSGIITQTYTPYYDVNNNNQYDAGTDVLGSPVVLVYYITAKTTWYADTDQDGYGDPNNSVQSCTHPSGYVSNNQDCNDNDASVYPNSAPVISGCPSNVTVYTGPGRTTCDQTATWTPPTVSNCGGVVTMTSNYQPGNTFSVGTTTVTYTATNEANVSSTCSFTVTVIDNTKPVITCPPPVLNSNCRQNTAPAITGTATATDNCDPNPSVTYSDATVQTGIGKYTITRTWTATDAAGNTATCTQKIFVVESPTPSITCPPNVFLHPGANCTVFTDPAHTGMPNTSGNCGTVSVTYFDVSSQDPNPTKFLHYNYVIVRTWIVTNAAGNHNACIQLITVTDNTPPTITCPANISTTTTLNKCSATVSVGTPQASDNCSPVTVTGKRSDGASLSSAFNSGVTTIYWSACDVSGNTVTCTQTVTVTDNQFPSVTCPYSGTVVRNTDNKVCTYKVRDGEFNATAKDNCGIASLKYTLSGATSGTGTSLSNVQLNSGLTTITWTAKDAQGNQTTCSFVVNVKDNQAPVVTCPSSLTLCKSNSGSYTVSPVTVSDNCGVATVTYIVKSGNTTLRSGVGTNASGTFPTGSSTIYWTVKDAAGNTGTCNTAVTVKTCTSGHREETEEAPVLPPVFTLNSYPNPFSTTTKIVYSLPLDSKVQIKVYDMLGREVNTIVEGSKSAGQYSTDYNTSRLTSGVYFARMIAVANGVEYIQSQKLIKVE